MNNSRAYLYTILADHCHEETTISRIMHGAELDATSIKSGATAKDTWHIILDEAEKQNLFYRLLQVLYKELQRYPRVKEAIRACAIEDGKDPNKLFVDYGSDLSGKNDSRYRLGDSYPIADSGFQWHEQLYALAFIALFPILLFAMLPISDNSMLLMSIFSIAALILASMGSALIKSKEWAGKTEIIISWLIGIIGILVIWQLRVGAVATPRVEVNPTPDEPPIVTAVPPEEGTTDDDSSTPTATVPSSTPDLTSDLTHTQQILSDAGALTADGKLIVGVRWDAPPYGYDPNWSDEKCDPSNYDPDFEPTGYDIDIAYSLAEDWLSDSNKVELRCVPLGQREDNVRQQTVFNGIVKLGIFAFSQKDDRCTTPHEAANSNNELVWCSQPYMLDGQGILTFVGSDITQICQVRWNNKRVLVSEWSVASNFFADSVNTFCGPSADNPEPFNSVETHSFDRLKELTEYVGEDNFDAYATDAEITNALANQVYSSLQSVPGKFGPIDKLVIAVTPDEMRLFELVENTLTKWKDNDKLKSLMDEANFACMDSNPNLLCGLKPIGELTPYTIQSGDTLVSISLFHLGSDKSDCIANYNNIPNKNNIKVGANIVIPLCP